MRSGFSVVHLRLSALSTLQEAEDVTEEAEDKEAAVLTDPQSAMGFVEAVELAEEDVLRVCWWVLPGTSPPSEEHPFPSMRLVNSFLDGGDVSR